MITSNDQVLSVRSQCILLNLNRSSIYYKPHPVDESELMNQIVEIHGVCLNMDTAASTLSLTERMCASIASAFNG